MLAPIKMMAVSSPSGIASFANAGTYYWTPPAGVTSVTITGRGGSKSSVYYAWSNQNNVGTRMSNGSSGTSIGSSLPYSRIRSDESSLMSNLNAVTTSSSGQSGSLWFLNSYYWFSTDSYWKYTPSSINRVYRRVGTFTPNSTLASGSGNFPDGGTGTFLLGGGTLQYRRDLYDYGTDSTGLGTTFPDDSTQAQYTDVAVVPQQQYTIVVGVDEGSDASFVTIEWE